MTTEEAEAARLALLDRASAGETIDPLELARIEGAIVLGSKVDEHQARRAAEAAEAERLAHIDQLRTDARAIDTTKAAQLYRTAVDALTALAAEGDRIAAESTRINHKLATLRPYPDDAVLAINSRNKRMIRADVLTFAGVRLHGARSGRRLGNDLALAALAEAAPTAGASRQATARAARIVDTPPLGDPPEGPPPRTGEA
jgi:hypothetical protein